eukprot:IDg13902t1
MGSMERDQGVPFRISNTNGMKRSVVGCSFREAKCDGAGRQSASMLSVVLGAIGQQESVALRRMCAWGDASGSGTPYGGLGYISSGATDKGLVSVDFLKIRKGGVARLQTQEAETFVRNRQQFRINVAVGCFSMPCRCTVHEMSVFPFMASIDATPSFVYRHSLVDHFIYGTSTVPRPDLCAVLPSDAARQRCGHKPMACAWARAWSACASGPARRLLAMGATGALVWIRSAPKVHCAWSTLVTAAFAAYDVAVVPPGARCLALATEEARASCVLSSSLAALFTGRAPCLSGHCAYLKQTVC